MYSVEQIYPVDIMQMSSYHGNEYLLYLLLLPAALNQELAGIGKRERHRGRREVR